MKLLPHGGNDWKLLPAMIMSWPLQCLWIGVYTNGTTAATVVLSISGPSLTFCCPPLFLLPQILQWLASCGTFHCDLSFWTFWCCCCFIICTIFPLHSPSQQILRGADAFSALTTATKQKLGVLTWQPCSHDSFLMFCSYRKALGGGGGKLYRAFWCL